MTTSSIFGYNAVAPHGDLARSNVAAAWLEDDWTPEPTIAELEARVASKFCAFVKEGGDTCGARPAKGTAYCIGHLRSLSKDEA